MKCENCGNDRGQKIKDTDVKMCPECLIILGKAWQNDSKAWAKHVTKKKIKRMQEIAARKELEKE